jgi:hypothetical protein
MMDDGCSLRRCRYINLLVALPMKHGNKYRLKKFTLSAVLVGDDGLRKQVYSVGTLSAANPQPAWPQIRADV